MEQDLIAPCGMNCALCSSYLAMKNDVKSKGVKMPYCQGCRPRGKQCAFIKKRCSLLMEGKVEHCFECDDFPCRNLEHLDKRYRTNFSMSMIANLEMIRDKGIEEFLKDQHDKWKCSKCHQMICCHNGLCFICDLSQL